MGKVTFKEDIAKSALTMLKRKIPYGWDLNIYRGCQHGCKYCYAMYSHKYLDSADFFNEIHVKTNIVEELERELKSEKWKREVINIGGVTDSYQPAEAKYQLMPEILKLLIKYRTPAIISTKSKLVLRDYDLIDELSRITYINVAATITAMDEAIRTKIEPGGSTSIERFEFLKAFRKTNASIGLHLMPIIPYITDDEQNFDRMFDAASQCGVHYVLAGTLYLRGTTRKYFLDFAQKEFPEQYEKILQLYKTGGADKEYKTALYEKVNRLRDQYGLSSSYMKPMREKLR
ncbi:MAG: radical SAM protein [Clostridia bacterium]|nr:radical SAM protein [Clostridia bacterium]